MHLINTEKQSGIISAHKQMYTYQKYLSVRRDPSPPRLIKVKYLQDTLHILQLQIHSLQCTLIKYFQILADLRNYTLRRHTTSSNARLTNCCIESGDKRKAVQAISQPTSHLCPIYAAFATRWDSIYNVVKGVNK